ncbi:MAG: TonB-dependent receptor [Vicinamibacterales bacterium]
MTAKHFLAAGTSLFACITAVPAWAQNVAEDASDGDEIVVTANKLKAQTLQDVPASIRVLTADTLEDANIQEFEDYVRMVPGLTFKDQGPGEKTIVTRGLVSTGAATTALYFGETNVTAFNDGEGGGRNVDFKLFDLERIEVLRGPQGTQYGASALGGVIRLLPAKPNLKTIKAGVEGQYSHTRFGGNNYELNGFLDIPLVNDVLGIRLVGWHVNNSGFIDNIRLDNKNINDEQTTGGRVTLLFKPTDDFKVTALAMIQNQDIGDGTRFNRVGDAALTFPGETPFVVEGDLQVTDFTVNNRVDDPRIFSLTGDYSFSWGNIVATTNYYQRDITFNFDSTPILLFFGVPIKAVSSFPEDRRTWSNELRFSSRFDGPFQLLAGLYYQKERIKSSSDVFTVGDDGIINEPSASVLSIVRDRRFKEKAIFGELSYDITPQWNVTVGARYASFDFVTDENALVPFFGPPTGPAPTKRGGDSSFIKKFNTSYELTDDFTIYATASEGFRRGGLNLNAFGSLFDIPETFGSDSLWNYEIGAKTNWLNDQLTVNATLYTLRWSDIQLEAVSELGGIEFFANAGKATVDGIELEISARPTRGLELSSAIGYSDARLTEDAPPLNFPPLPTEGRKGDRLNNVPKWTASFSAQYTWPVVGNVNALARGDVTYTGSSDTRIAGDRDPFNVRLKSYTIANLKLGLETDLWSLSMFADNVFDERTRNDAINEVTNILAFFTTRPRTMGVRAGYRF